MANDYFDSGDYTALPRLALARAEAVNGIIAAIVAGFDRLPSEAELKQDRVTYAVTTGSANAYEVDLPHRPSSYTAGMTLKIKVHAANAAGACTINLMGAGGALLGAVAVKTINGDDPAANDLPLNGVVTLIHNGTHFRLAGAAAGAVASAAASASAAATSANNAAQSEANALSHYNSFRGVYYGTLSADPSVDPLGNPVGEGDWYWNTTTKRARIYNGSDFEDIGIAQLSQYVFTAEGGETSISGVDDNGNTLSYTVGFVWVFKNGVRLVPGDDYTATDGTSIDDLTALSPGDVIAVDAFSPFSLADCLNKNENLADLPDKPLARSNLDVYSKTEVDGAVLVAAPPGAVSAFAMSAAPPGWLKANGAAVARASYAALDAAIYVGDGDNATALFGYRCTDPMNPSTSRDVDGDYIVLPDLRGEFVRGWADDGSVDSGRAFGSAQSDELKAHTHTIFADGGAQSGSGARRPAVTSQSNDTTSGSTGGTETRPRNIALLYCIKY